MRVFVIQTSLSFMSARPKDSGVGFFVCSYFMLRLEKGQTRRFELYPDPVLKYLVYITCYFSKIPSYRLQWQILFFLILPDLYEN